jgi:hypothetical protein
MTLPESISLESLVKNKIYSLEIFKFDDKDTQVDRSRRLPLPTIILEQHYNKIIYKKFAKSEIKGEFVFLYNKLTDEQVIMPTNNYNKLLEISTQAGIGEVAKRFIEYFDGKIDIDLEFVRGKYLIDEIPPEFKPANSWIKFTADNEPYINKCPVIIYANRNKNAV